jgi:hypothetical protein
MPYQKGAMLMLLYTEIQTVTFGGMNTNIAHLSSQIGVRIWYPVNNFVDTPFWYDAFEIQINEILSLHIQLPRLID